MKMNNVPSKKVLDETKPDHTQLFNNDYSMMLIVDPESLQIINANNAASNYYGWSCEELEQMTISQVAILPEEKIRVKFTKATNGIKNNFVCKHQLHNGAIHDVGICAVPIITSDKTQLCLIIHDIDTVEKEIAETIYATRCTKVRQTLKEKDDELERSHERFMVAVNGSQDGIWDWDLYTNEIYFSPRWKAMIGYEDHEFPNKFSVFKNGIHPDDRQKVMSQLGQYVKEEISKYKVEFRFRHKNGNYIWILMRGATLRDENGFPYRMAGSHTDITEMKKAEEKIHEELMKRRLLIENSSEGIVILNLNGKVLEANKKYAEMVGYSPDELLGMHLWDWDTKWTREEILNMLKNRFNEGTYLDTQICRKDGSCIDMEISSTAMDIGGEKIIFSSCRDITERKLNELALLQAKALAEQSNRIKSEFIANVSHELRTPLTSVIGFSQVLNEKIVGDLNENQMRYVSHIYNSGTHLLELINDILDISKIESGNMDYTPEIVDIGGIMNETIALTEPLIKEKKIAFEYHKGFDELKANVDRMKIKQIMFNLLSNAIKFAPINGKVWLDSKIIDGNVQISVSDNGIGIPLDKQKTIFEPFKQVSSFTSRTHGGTGLGLAIVKYYVEMHSGEIHIESEVGKGSTFTFTIPIDSSILCNQ